MIVLWILLSILLGFLYTELVGYFVHQLLHSEKVPYLSRSHMIHHLRHYGPKMSMRSDDYLKPEGKASIGTIGLEWLVPIAGVALPSIAVPLLLGIPLLYVVIWLGAAIVWGVMGFSIMHDAMHLRGFWMLRSKIFGRWFRRIRRLHDIHHVNINPQGRMQMNFGMCFFWFDKLFGTYAPRIEHFNEKGYEEAKKKYAYIWEE